MRTFSYEQRLQILNLESLELRRVKADLTMYFKIINNFVDLNCDDFYKFSSNATRTNGFKLLMPISVIQRQLKMFLISDV